MQRELARKPRLWIRQLVGFIRKELTEVIHQPRLLGLLVLGPFLILLLFGVGYRNERLVLRALFVAPSDGVVAQSLESYREQLGEFIDVRGLTPDVLDGRQQLLDDEVDVLVVFPSDPVERLLRNERVPISVIHDELDPIQQVATEFAVRLAIDEVNATVVASAVRQGQETVPVEALLDSVTTASEAARRAADDGGDARVDAAVQELSARWTALRGSLQFAMVASDELSGAGLGAAGAPATVRPLVDQLDAEVAVIREGTPAERSARLTRIADLLAQLEKPIRLGGSVDPAVLVRPFVGDTLSATPERVEIADFYAPATVVLLLQHLGLTLGSLSLVRDRALGLFEMYRVGPVSPVQALAGKFVSYLVVGLFAGAALLALIVWGMGVPVAGRLVWLVATIALVSGAATAMGLFVSMVASTDAQAVQYGMTLLLASLLLGGFFLDIDRLSYPVKAVSLLLPLTYGIPAVQDVMLRGIDPNASDLLGLGALTVVFSLLATWRFRLSMRVV